MGVFVAFEVEVEEVGVVGEVGEARGVGSAGSGRGGAMEEEEEGRKNLLNDLDRLVRSVCSFSTDASSSMGEEDDGSTFDDGLTFFDDDADEEGPAAEDEETTDVGLFAATESKSRGGFSGRARGEVPEVVLTLILGFRAEGWWKGSRRELKVVVVVGLLEVGEVGEVGEDGTGGGGGNIFASDLIASPTSEEILPSEGRLPDPATGGSRVVVLVGEPTLIVEEEETFPSLVGCSCSTAWEAGLVGVEGGEAYEVLLSTEEFDAVVEVLEADRLLLIATGD